MRGKKSETMTSVLTLQLRSFTFEQLETMDARRMNTCQDRGIVVSHTHVYINVRARAYKGSPSLGARLCELCATTHTRATGHDATRTHR